MPEPTSSANPPMLLRYAETAATINAQLCQEGERLKAVLESFAQSCIEPTHDIGPALADKLCAYVRRMSPKDRQAHEVGLRFMQADGNDSLIADLGVATRRTNYSTQNIRVERVRVTLVAERAQLEEELARLGEGRSYDTSPPSLAERNMDRRRKQLQERIGAIDIMLKKLDSSLSLLHFYTSLPQVEAQRLAAHGSNIDEQLLAATFKHEGDVRNFGTGWWSPEEAWNEAHDWLPFIREQTSVGIGQIQTRHAVRIAREAYGMELTYEQARELLSVNDQFSAAIAAEHLAEKAAVIKEPYRNSRTIFTAYAASEKSIRLLNDVGWNSDRAKQSVAQGVLERETYENLRKRYEEAWPKANS